MAIASLLRRNRERLVAGVRDVSIGDAVKSWLRDVMVSWRGLRKRPGFAAVAVVSLTLGIGANALVFSVVNSVLLQPLSYPDADRLVAVWLTPPNEPDQRFGTNTGVFFTIRDNTTLFEGFGAGRLNEAFSVTSPGDAMVHRIPSQWFSADLVQTLGVQPLLGTWPNEPFGLAISYGLWQRMFAGAPDVLGTNLDIGIGPAVIDAVMPEGYHLMHPDTDLWLYHPDQDMARAQRSPNRLFSLIGRLKPGVTVEQAQGEMDSLAQVISKEFPESHLGWGFKVESLRDAYVGGVRQSLWVFQGAVFFVLLIAASNVGALVMSRAVARQKELAIRAALGAGRWRLIRQLLTDNLVLSFLGATFGVGLASIGVRLLAASGIEGVPRLAEVSMDWRVVSFAALTALGTGIVFGVLPALQVSRPNLMEVLREGSGRSSPGVRQQRLRTAFVVGQISLALIIIVASGLMLRSLALIHAAEVGFNPAKLTVLEVPFPPNFYRNTGENTSAGGLLVEFDSRLADKSEAIVQRLSTLPGVRSVAATSTPPLGRLPRRAGVRLEGETRLPAEQAAPTVEWYPVSAGYFETLGIPLLRGRTFDAGDQLGSRPVAIINAAMAERLWAGQDPIGRVLQTDVFGAPARVVVGIVGDVRQDRYQRVPQPQLYIPRLQVPLRMDMATALDFLATSIVVKTDGNVNGMNATLRAGVRDIDPTLPVSQIRTVEEYASGQLQDLRRATLLLSAFGVVAVALALIGIFGVVSDFVTQRHNEIGIRMALGAQKREVLALVLRQGAAVVMFGLAIGTGAALTLTGLLRGLLYGVSNTDPLSFAAAILLLTAVGLLACYFAARRASRIEPVVALRSD
jgi:putative ABC transport system permease protein